MSPLVIAIMSLVQALIGVIGDYLSNSNKTNEELQAAADKALADFGVAVKDLPGKLAGDDAQVDAQLKGA